MRQILLAEASCCTCHTEDATGTAVTARCEEKEGRDRARYTKLPENADETEESERKLRLYIKKIKKGEKESEARHEDKFEI